MSRTLPEACSCRLWPRSSGTSHQGYPCHGYTHTHLQDHHLHTHACNTRHTTHVTEVFINTLISKLVLCCYATVTLALTITAASAPTINEHLWSEVNLWICPLSDDSNPVTESRGCPHCPAGATICSEQTLFITLSAAPLSLTSDISSLAYPDPCSPTDDVSMHKWRSGYTRLGRMFHDKSMV